MGVESVQPRRGPWTDVRAHCRRRQADARGRVGSFKVSPRAPRVLTSTSLSRPRSSGWRGWSTSQRTNARTTNSGHGWLATPSPPKPIRIQHLRKLAVQRFEAAATRPLSACPPPPVPASLGGEASVWRNAGCMYRSSCHRRAKTRLCFWAPMLCRLGLGLDQRQDTQRQLRALHSVEGRGKERAFQPPSTRVGRLAGQAETA